MLVIELTDGQTLELPNTTQADKRAAAKREAELAKAGKINAVYADCPYA